MRGGRKAAIALCVLTVIGAAITLTLTGCQSFGASADGERLARIRQSPAWHDDRFSNPQPSSPQARSR